MEKTIEKEHNKDIAAKTEEKGKINETMFYELVKERFCYTMNITELIDKNRMIDRGDLSVCIGDLNDGKKYIEDLKNKGDKIKFENLKIKNITCSEIIEKGEFNKTMFYELRKERFGIRNMYDLKIFEIINRNDLSSNFGGLEQSQSYIENLKQMDLNKERFSS